MRLTECSVFITFICLCLENGVLSMTVTLDPPVTDTTENDSITFLCSYHGLEKNPASRWTYSKELTNGAIANNNISCVTSGFLANTSLYACSCNEDGTFSVTLKKVDRKQNGAFWICRQGNMESNIVYLAVKVPVETVAIDRPAGNSVSLMEGSFATLHCYTSYSSPPPTVDWLLDKGTTDTADDEVILDDVFYTDRINTNGLVSITATLILKAKETMSGWTVYCLANNTLHHIVKSRPITLDVTSVSSDKDQELLNVTVVVLGVLSFVLLIIALLATVTAIRRGRSLSRMSDTRDLREDNNKATDAKFPVYEDIDPSKVSNQKKTKVEMQRKGELYERLNSISGPQYDATCFSKEKADKTSTQIYANLRLSYVKGKHPK